MMTKFRTITAAGTAALALAGGAALTGSAAQADGPGRALPAAPRAQRTLVSTCNGGPSVTVFGRTTNFQSVTGGTTADVEGSQWSVRGPRRGTDTVLVTLSSLATSGGAGELSSVAFYKDGVGTSEGSKYYTYNGVLGPASVQFCTKIGHGLHTLSLKVIDPSGGPTSMYNPTITYQRFS